MNQELMVHKTTDGVRVTFHSMEDGCASEFHIDLTDELARKLADAIYLKLKGAVN